MNHLQGADISLFAKDICWTVVMYNTKTTALHWWAGFRVLRHDVSSCRKGLFLCWLENEPSLFNVLSYTYIFYLPRFAQVWLNLHFGWHLRPHFIKCSCCTAAQFAWWSPVYRTQNPLFWQEYCAFSLPQYYGSKCICKIQSL